MTVYVDNSRIRYLGMVFCHMVADTTDELLEMCDRIGVNRQWIQKAGTEREHFDICITKRKCAIRAAARPVTQAELAGVIRRKRENR